MFYVFFFFSFVLLLLLLCGLGVFCFSILFMFLLSFGHETLWALHYVVQGEGFSLFLFMDLVPLHFQI